MNLGVWECLSVCICAGCEVKSLCVCVDVREFTRIFRHVCVCLCVEMNVHLCDHVSVGWVGTSEKLRPKCIKHPP